MMLLSQKTKLILILGSVLMAFRIGARQVQAQVQLNFDVENNTEYTQGEQILIPLLINTSEYNIYGLQLQLILSNFTSDLVSLTFPDKPILQLVAQDSQPDNLTAIFLPLQIADVFSTKSDNEFLQLELNNLPVGEYQLGVDAGNSMALETNTLSNLLSDVEVFNFSVTASKIQDKQDSESEEDDDTSDDNINNDDSPDDSASPSPAPSPSASPFNSPSPSPTSNPSQNTQNSNNSKKPAKNPQVLGETTQSSPAPTQKKAQWTVCLLAIPSLFLLIILFFLRRKRED